MFCPKCGRENLEINKFCNGCGASLMSAITPLQTFVPPPPPKKYETRIEQPKTFVPSSGKPKTPAVNRVEITAKLQKSFADFQTWLNQIFKTFLVATKSIFGKIRLPKNGLSTKVMMIGVGSVAVVGLTGVIFWFSSGKGAVYESVLQQNTLESSQVSNTNESVSPASIENMVYVSGGEFMMGNDNGGEYEHPAHRVSVKPFYIDKTEVTCEEYKKFVDETKYVAPASWTNNNFPTGSARKPVTGVKWDDAAAYAKWKGKRLPSETEWEYAARGIDGRSYPWGNLWQPGMANADNQKESIQEVGIAQGKSPFGCFDMSGNAWEWTSSEAKAYPNGKAFDLNTIEPKIIRGGFFGSKKEKATTTFRAQWGARNETDYSNTSFRCVKDAANR